MSADGSTLTARRVAIVGLGLIGGSIARGLRAAGFDGTLTGVTANSADAQRAVALGLVDGASEHPASILADAELIIIAVPVGLFSQVLADVVAVARADAIITDVSSSKQGVLAAAQAALGATINRFVPGHPISGTERSGLDAGFAGLFEHRRVILTPGDATARHAVEQVTALWQWLGADVVTMTAQHHDDVLAATSHLPHVLAYTLVDTLARMAERQEIFAYAAGGFRDFTRIASSEPALWRDIVCSNRAPLLAVLDRFMADLSQVREAIAHDDQQSLVAGFTRAKQARDQFTAGRQEPHP